MKTPRQIAHEVTASVPSHFDDVTNAARAGMLEALRWAAEVSAAQSAESARWFILDKIAELEKS